MKLLICGSRDWDSPRWMACILEGLLQDHGFDTVIHGDASGADRMAGSWAYTRGLQVCAYPADWKTHHKAAGPIRNRKMLVEGQPDMVVAFITKPLQESKGTSDMIAISEKANVPTDVYWLVIS